MKKKILFSLVAIAAAAAVIIGGTTAFFSDTETSTGNTFTAGAIDLTIDNESYVTNEDGVLVYNNGTSWGLSDLTNQLFFNFLDLKPGDRGEDTISLHVNNNDAWACMNINLTATLENGQTEPEAKEDLTAGENEGELQNELYFAFWADDGDNVYEEGEVIFKEGLAKDLFDGKYWTLSDSEKNVWLAQNIAPLTGAQTYYIAKYWCYGELGFDAVPQDTFGKTGENGPLSGRGTGFTCNGQPVTNVSQTDGIKADVSFYAVQSRNNAGFTCDSLNEVVINAEGPFDGWNGPGVLKWQSEGRFGSNTMTGDWEVGVGTNTQNSGTMNHTNNVMTSGTPVPFTVNYDGNTASFTVNGNTASYVVGPVTNTADLNIIAGKVSSGAGDSVELTNLKLDGNALNPDVLIDTDNTDAKYLVISSEDLSGGFILTGMVEFNWTPATTAGSRPAFQVQVRD